MPEKPKTKPTAADYEKLGRAIEGALINDYLDLLGNTRRQLKLTFLRGIASGLGYVVGASLVVALLVWVLHLLGGLPVIGHTLNYTGNQIKQK
jgi:hypothetical protein